MKVKRILLHILWISTAVALIAAGFGCVFNGNGNYSVAVEMMYRMA